MDRSELERIAYGRSAGSETERAAALAALSALDARAIEPDDALASDVVVATATGSPSDPAPDLAAARRAALDGEPLSDTGPLTEPVDGRNRRRPTVRAALTAIGALAVLAVGAGIGYAAHDPLQPPEPVVHPVALLTLDGPADADDVPPIALGGGRVDPTAWRRLDLSTPEGVTGSIGAAFGALDVRGAPCLLVETATRVLAQSCTSLDDFADAGLRATWSDATTLYGVGWRPDGTLSATATKLTGEVAALRVFTRQQSHDDRAISLDRVVADPAAVAAGSPRHVGRLLDVDPDSGEPTIIGEGFAWLDTRGGVCFGTHLDAADEWASSCAPVFPRDGFAVIVGDGEKARLVVWTPDGGILTNAADGS